MTCVVEEDVAITAVVEVAVVVDHRDPEGYVNTADNTNKKV